MELAAARDAVAEVSRELGRPPGLGPRAERFVRGSFPAFFLGCPVACGYAGCQLSEGADGQFMGIMMGILGFALCGMWWHLFELLVRRVSRAFAPSAGARRVEAERAAPSARQNVTEIVGRISGPVAEPLRSPLRGEECVAARIAGLVGAFTIDDAVMVDFTVETDAGERVRVGPAEVVLEIEPGGGIALGDDTRERLRPFLDARGIPAEGQPTGIAEDVLRVGDVVRVEGATVESPDPLGAGGGLREAPMIRRFEGTPDRPIVIRRARG